MTSIHNEDAVPKFSLNYPRYDPSGVLGRFKNNLAITNPALLALSSEQILDHAKTIESWKAKEPAALAKSDTDLWYSRKVKDSCVHPDTGEVIPRPFRMCGYTAFGTPIVFFMLLPMTSSSLLFTGIAQWANQSHNAAVNWCNRSVTEGGDPKWDIMKGYTAAVTSAVSIGVGSNMLIDQLKVNAANKILLKKFTPFPAVCAASVVNMCMMRLPEIQRGIKVYEKDADGGTGPLVGTSKVAAIEAIQSTALVRVVLVACAILIPQILYAGCVKTLHLAKPHRAAWALPIQGLCAGCGYGLGVPLSLSCFTQDMEIPRSQLEPHLSLPKFNPRTFDTVRFNKGM